MSILAALARWVLFVEPIIRIVNVTGPQLPDRLTFHTTVAQPLVAVLRVAGRASAVTGRVCQALCTLTPDTGCPYSQVDTFCTRPRWWLDRDSIRSRPGTDTWCNRRVCLSSRRHSVPACTVHNGILR
jgi:hypothetical protein